MTQGTVFASETEQVRVLLAKTKKQEQEIDQLKSQNAKLLSQ